jgi:hypothetical protein
MCFIVSSFIKIRSGTYVFRVKTLSRQAWVLSLIELAFFLTVSLSSPPWNLCVCVCVFIFPYFTVQPGDYFHNTSYELKTLKDTPASRVLISFSNSKLEGRTEGRNYTSEFYLWVVKWCMVIQLECTRKLGKQLYKGMLLVCPQMVRVNTAWKSTKFEEVATLANGSGVR